MAKTVRFVGNICLFLAGLVVGVILTIFGTSPLVTATSNLGELNGLLLLPTTWYVVAATVLVALSILLRKAASRVL
ncbi:MAG: hypothetical protein JWN50_815 [Parcubacteria group bacterium]|nr:hypothetical protein [Parcubacteria group bacterium]